MHSPHALKHSIWKLKLSLEHVWEHYLLKNTYNIPWKADTATGCFRSVFRNINLKLWPPWSSCLCSCGWLWLWTLKRESRVKGCSACLFVFGFASGQCLEIHTAIGYSTRTGQTRHGFLCSIIELSRNMSCDKHGFAREYFLRSKNALQHIFCDMYVVSNVPWACRNHNAHTGHIPQLVLKPMDGNGQQAL